MSATRVTVAEAALLSVARALVSPEAGPSVEGTLGGSASLTKIGPTAMSILQSTLAKGSVRMLARLGGARPRVRAGGSGMGRAFQARTSPVLAFGSYTFELVRWLTVTALDAREPVEFASQAVTLGDQLAAYLALRLVAGGKFERVVAPMAGLRTPLTWLGFPRLLARYGAATAAPSMAGLLATADPRTVVDCLASDLAERWARGAVWDPNDVLGPEVAVRIGTAERAVVGGFLDEVEARASFDLATFLIEAGMRAAPRGVSASDLALRAIPRVHSEGSLRSRTEARRRAGALFLALARLGKKRDALALVSFVDDDYELAQAVLRSWEPLDRDTFRRANEVLGLLDALEGPTTAASV